jgi:hypothetical protein
MITAFVNLAKYDWSTWLVGIWRAVIQGGSGAVVSSIATIGIDPEHFNLTTGLGHVFEQMGAVFLVMGLIHMFIFLQTHGMPDPSTQIQAAEARGFQSGAKATGEAMADAVQATKDAGTGKP